MTSLPVSTAPTAVTGDPGRDRPRALLALLGVQLLFGGMPVFGKLALPSFGPDGVVFARIAGAAVAFILLQYVMRLPWVPRADLARLIGCSALGIVGNQLFFLHGLARTSAAHAALLTTTIPAITLGISIAVGIERLTARRALGLAIAGAGAALLILAREPGGGAATPFGDALILCNTVLYSFYLVLSRPLLARHHPISVLSGLFAWGVMLLLPFTGVPLLAGGGLLIEAPAPAWWALAFLVLGPTIGAYGLNIYALRFVPPSTVALWIYIQPPVAAALAIPLLGEQPTPVLFVAGALTFLGMWLGRGS